MHGLKLDCGRGGALSPLLGPLANTCSLPRAAPCGRSTLLLPSSSPSTQRPYFKLHPVSLSFCLPSSLWDTHSLTWDVSKRGFNAPEIQVFLRCSGILGRCLGKHLAQRGEYHPPLQLERLSCASVSCNRTPCVCLNQGFFLRVRKPSSLKVR